MVLDEAYMDFWDQSLLPEVENYDNLIILKTVSKALGMAALRLGFAIAAPSLTAILRAAKSPYNVNAVTQAMASVILNNTTYHDIYPQLLCQSREMLMEGMRWLQADSLIDWVCESCTNFVFLQVPDAGELYGEMRERGILVRLFGDNRLRITAGTESENREVLETMHFCCKKSSSDEIKEGMYMTDLIDRKRSGSASRTTKETDIAVTVCLEGGPVQIETGIGFLITCWGVCRPRRIRVDRKGQRGFTCRWTSHGGGYRHRVGGRSVTGSGQKNGIARFGSFIFPWMRRWPLPPWISAGVHFSCSTRLFRRNVSGNTIPA